MGDVIVPETTVTVENPEYQGEKGVDSQGRVYLGQEYSGKRVYLIVDSVEEDVEDKDD